MGAPCDPHILSGYKPTGLRRVAVKLFIIDIPSKQGDLIAVIFVHHSQREIQKTIGILRKKRIAIQWEIHLPDAHAQYQFMSDEAREKIMLGHGIVSQILLGIKDNTGFGNNAEELRTASVLMDNVIIKPLQDEILNGLEEILAFNKISLDLYFVTLQPIEFTQLDNISTKVKREEETGEKLSSVALSSDCDKDNCDDCNCDKKQVDIQMSIEDVITEVELENKDNNE